MSSNEFAQFATHGATMKMFASNSQASAGLLRHLLIEGQSVGPRDHPTLELCPFYACVQNPTGNPITCGIPERDEVVAEYTRKEFGLYGVGTRDVNEFAKASKFWRHLANPDGTINSNYGWLIFYRLYEPEFTGTWTTQFNWVVHALLGDRHSRQAYMHIALPQHKWVGNKDQVCTLNIHFLIRDCKLITIVKMRSCDIIKGFTYDAPYFAEVSGGVLDAVQPQYEDVRLGPTYWEWSSLHLYTRDIELAEQITEATNGNDV